MTLHISPDTNNSIKTSADMQWRNSFSHLHSDFFTRLTPSTLPAPYWVGRSEQAALALGLSKDWFASDEALQALTGNQVLPGSEPLASVYSGHQFGIWAGQLGDGRAILLGEIQTAKNPSSTQEIQLKGAGRTPYSRGGDGRAVLRSSVREFLCCEAMHGLGIPTTRALCVTGSDAVVRREALETAAVVTRSAPSFIRFGHFEHFSHSDQHAQLKTLADYVIDRHYPACRDSTAFNGNPYAAFLEAVSERTAHMVAQWQAVGFCHGVMNTDNMSILGLTIDYGPFQFLDGFNPAHICNHSDTQGRYAYNKQPNVAYWNLFCLGQALLPLISTAEGDQELTLAALESYKTVFPTAMEACMRAKLGLTASASVCSTSSATQPPQSNVRGLIESILQLLSKTQVDYTMFWRRLSNYVTQQARSPSNLENPEPLRDLFLDRAAFDVWLLQYSEHLTSVDIAQAADLMLRTNPKFVLRNHLGEQAIRAAKVKDFSEVDRLRQLLESPFDEHPGFEAYADFPPDWASGIEISCSS